MSMESDAPVAAESNTISLALPNGAKVSIKEASGPKIREQDVTFATRSFSKISEIIEGIGDSLHQAKQTLKPNKMEVEFGLEIAVESGELTALLVKGGGTSHLTVKFEWGQVES